jgi:ABC-type multidrug transport system ATPase subunit
LAGKSTLLNVLAGKVKGKIEGTVLYNGNTREQAKPLLRHQAYVMQHDILMASQTGKPFSKKEI